VPEDTVEAAALRSPYALLVLQHFGIDVCCGGHLTLAQAADAAGVPVETVLRALEPAMATPAT
jgi:iron-sulfur cluster repair protein YtfE (RIC family)